MKKQIFIGNDPREVNARLVARHSLFRHMTRLIPVQDLMLEWLQRNKLYTRPTIRNEDGRLIDVLSVRSDYDGSISTEHANARFLVPSLARSGWALFCDCDVLFRADITKIFDGLDPSIPLYCVKHNYQPKDKIKMDGQVQTQYEKKNWSSMMIFNCDHPANFNTMKIANTLPGRDLHRFCWLDEEEIGALDPKWNWLVGHSDKSIDPAMVHFTSGTPDMPGYENCDYAEEWRQELASSQ